MSFEERCGLSDTYQNRLKRIYNLISINEYRALVMLTIAHKYFETQKSKINYLHQNFIIINQSWLMIY